MGNVVDSEMEDDTVTLPDGQDLPASPENRRRAAEMWQLDNKGQPERVERELDDEDERVERAEIELAEMRRRFECEREERLREDQERERVERERQMIEQMAERQTMVERDNERLKLQVVTVENERLRNDLTVAREVQKLKDELAEERGKNRLPPADVNVTVPADDAATATQRMKDAIRYSVPLDDPAVDLITDFSNCVVLEDRLKAVGTDGNPRTSTVTEFFNRTNEKSQDLKLILTEPAAGSSLESRLKQYRVAFHSQKHPGKQTMLVVMLRAIEKFCPDEKLRLIAVLKVAAIQTHAARSGSALVVKQTGQLPTVNTESSGLRMAELPGMVEMILDMKDEFVDSFEELILAYICFNPNVTAELDDAEEAWNVLRDVDMTQCESMITGEETLFNQCTGWLNGKKICQDFHRFRHLLSLSPDTVKRHHIQLIASPLTAGNERSLMEKDWTALLKVFRDAWSAAACEFRMEQLMQMVKPQQTYSMMAGRSEQRIRFPIGQQQSQQRRQNSLQDISQWQDIDLQCVRCSGSFVWLIDDQKYQKSQGWENQPGRCKTCRDKEKPCTMFENTGECRYGDKCRFSHAASGMTPGSINAPCKHFNTGNCLSGDKCPFSHSKTPDADAVPEEGFAGLAPIKKAVRFGK